MGKLSDESRWQKAERLTDAVIKALPAPTERTRFKWDTEVRGFGLRCTTAGARAFVLRDRVAGKERMPTIGSFPSWSTAKAREEAKRLKRLFESGVDPLAEREAARGAPTIAALCAHYQEARMPNLQPATQREVREIIDNLILPAFGNVKITALRHSDVDRWHRKIGERAPFRANRAAAYLSSMFTLAIREEWITSNPCQGVQKFHEAPRDRYLSEAEIARLWQALDAHPHQNSANAIRLMLLCGSRRGETLSATWGQFDLQEATWSKPYTSTKQRLFHRAPLSEPAVNLLRKMQAEAGDSPYLFPHSAPTAAMGQCRRTWLAVCKSAGITNCRLHDLRHSFASILASKGQSLLVIGGLLGHRNPATTARYSHLVDSALRAATNAAGAVIDGGGKVVPLRKKHAA